MRGPSYYCNGVLASCLLLVLAGLVALGSLLVDRPERALALVVSLAGASMVVVGSSDWRVPGLVVAAVIVQVVSGLAGLAASTALAMAASAMASRNGYSRGFAGLLVPALAAYEYLGAEGLSAYSALALVAASLYAYEERGRGHAFTMSVLAPAALVAPPLASASMAASALLVAVFVAGGVSGPGCPFRIDGGLGFAGTILSITGVALGLLAGQAQELGYIVWLTGFLLLEAGVLVPESVLAPQPSSGHRGVGSHPDGYGGTRR